MHISIYKNIHRCIVITHIWYIYIYMVPPPQDQYFRTIYCYLRYFVVFFLCLNVCFFWRFKKLCRVVKALPLIKLFSFNRMIFTKPRENQKTKKPKLFRECLVWGSCLVFLVFLEFFWFFLVMTLKKLKKLKVFLVFWINWWLKTCEKTKKLKVFFGFLHGLFLHVF